MNVVFYGPAPFPNGYATSKRRRFMMDYLVSKDISCKVIVTPHPNFESLNNPVKGRLDNIIFEDLSVIKKRSYFLYFKRKFGLLKEFFDQKNKNIIIIPSSIGLEDFVILVLSKFLGYKIIFDKTESITIRKSKRFSLHFFFIKLIDDISVWLFDGILVISTRLFDTYKKCNKNIILLLNSTEISYSEIQLIKKHAKILYSGTFEVKNGPHLLIDAVNKLYSEGYNIELYITGLCNSQLFEKYFNSNRRKQYIHFLGFISEEELFKLLNECDILTMTRIDSKEAEYGFPYKLSEALALGKPIVCTNVGDVNNYVTHLFDVYLSEPNNVDSLYKGLKFFIDNRENAFQIANNAQVTASRFFNKKKNGEILLDFLSKL